MAHVRRALSDLEYDQRSHRGIEFDHHGLLDGLRRRVRNFLLVIADSLPLVRDSLDSQRDGEANDEPAHSSQARRTALELARRALLGVGVCCGVGARVRGGISHPNGAVAEAAHLAHAADATRRQGRVRAKARRSVGRRHLAEVCVVLRLGRLVDCRARAIAKDADVSEALHGTAVGVDRARGVVLRRLPKDPGCRLMNSSHQITPTRSTLLGSGGGAIDGKLAQTQSPPAATGAGVKGNSHSSAASVRASGAGCVRRLASEPVVALGNGREQAERRRREPNRE